MVREEHLIKHELFTQGVFFFFPFPNVQYVRSTDYIHTEQFPFSSGSDRPQTTREGIPYPVSNLGEAKSARVILRLPFATLIEQIGIQFTGM